MNQLREDYREKKKFLVWEELWDIFHGWVERSLFQNIPYVVMGS